MVLEATSLGDICPSCLELRPRKYRCLECFNCLNVICSNCIVARHHQQPFHRIQKWTGTHFEVASLHNLGLVLYLGHNGSSCPASCNLINITVVHLNGLHTRAIQYCDCNDLIPNYQQLILARLFPATIKMPRTVFTFQLLETFHQLSLSSKITPYDYFNSLTKLTNYAFPQEVEVLS
jgi:hypothetical protein